MKLASLSRTDVNFLFNPCRGRDSLTQFRSTFSGHHSFRLETLKLRQYRSIVKLRIQASYGGRPENEDSSSKAAKIRSEVNAPFRSIRMFFSLAFIASGTIGALISIPRLIAALSGVSTADPVDETLKTLGIDLAAVVLFFLLYRSDSNAEKKSIARFTREETLSKLRVELTNKRIVSIGQLRGNCRVLIVTGSREHILEVFKQAKEVMAELLERGVIIIPFFRDGSQSSIEELTSFVTDPPEAINGSEKGVAESARRFVALPLYTNEWTKWLDEQMSFAKVANDQPVYISLRLDGRVRASGVGYPPIRIIAAQLPPMKGIWKGPLDGMDGRVW